MHLGILGVKGDAGKASPTKLDGSTGHWGIRQSNISGSVVWSWFIQWWPWNESWCQWSISLALPHKMAFATQTAAEHVWLSICWTNNPWPPPTTPWHRRGFSEAPLGMLQEGQFVGLFAAELHLSCLSLGATLIFCERSQDFLATAATWAIDSDLCYRGKKVDSGVDCDGSCLFSSFLKTKSPQLKTSSHGTHGAFPTFHSRSCVPLGAATEGRKLVASKIDSQGHWGSVGWSGMCVRFNSYS